MYIYFVHFIQTFVKLSPNLLWVKKNWLSIQNKLSATKMFTPK